MHLGFSDDASHNKHSPTQARVLHLVRISQGDREQATIGLRLLMAEEGTLRDAVATVGVAKPIQDASADYKGMARQAGDYRANHSDDD